MALQGWRLFGVTAIIIIYIGGVLFLTMNKFPGSHPKRIRIERFAEFSSIRRPRLAALPSIRWCRPLKFRNPEELPFDEIDATSPQQDALNGHRRTGVTALASFPGSGNTWLRYLLQQSTGILTGSIYVDYGLMKTGFPAENIFNKSVLLVKTHEFGPNSFKFFDKAILLVRDPEKAILAEFNRVNGGHLGFASPDIFKRIKGKTWKGFVTKSIGFWEKLTISWGNDFPRPTKIVFYDDLVHNTEEIMRQILDFLDFPIDEGLLKCALKRREGIFRRKKRLVRFDPYTDEMRAELRKRSEVVYDALGRSADNRL